MLYKQDPTFSTASVLQLATLQKDTNSSVVPFTEI
jgi:hypothetical protein